MNRLNPYPHPYRKRRVLMLLTFLLVLPPAFAAPWVSTQDQTIQYGVTKNDLEKEAHAWGLTSTEFNHYRWLMQHTPSGRWYVNLDPAEVLALNATNATDLMKYAKIQARQMHARVTQELAFNAIYAKAYRFLYPREKAIMPKNSSPVLLQSGDRIWLFLNPSTPLGPFVYQHLLNRVQGTPGTVLDIYFVGKNITDEAIQAWALKVGLSPKMVNQQVTLNYGQARFNALSHDKNINLPFVGIIHQTHFMPVSLSSVL